MNVVQILTEQAENDGYWVGVKRSSHEDDEWVLSLMEKYCGEFHYARGGCNHHFRLTTAQILELPPVAELLAACIELLKWYDAGGPMYRRGHYPKPETDGFKLARDAVTKAKGEQ